MKKILLSLITLIVGAMGTFAQTNLVATLQHGNNIQAFYGIDALKEAHAAAADGDIIALSAGEFNSCEINKAITLRGEGISKTTLKTGMKFTIPQGSAYPLTVEGLQLTNNNPTSKVYVYGSDGTEKAVFSKCLFIQFGSSNEISFNNCNATIVQCRTAYGMVEAQNSHVSIINSKIDGFYQGTNAYFDIQNCAVNGVLSLRYSSIKNSIIVSNGNPGTLDASNSTSHCLVYSGISGFTDSWNVDSWENIIVGNPTGVSGIAWSLCELTETAAATYLGTDGTQVGMYGGMYPYDETPNYPQVKKLDVIGTHTNGKLNVKINVE